MRRKPSCSSHSLQKEKLRRGLWSPDEDEKLYSHITSSGGVGCWSTVPKQAGLQRCGKSCRLRWINYLRPDLKRGNFTQLDEDLIIRMHEIVGNRWSQIAAQLPGRTDNEIKNYWNSNLKKKLKKMGIDPDTHKPSNDQSKLHHREGREQHFHTPSKLLPPPLPPFNPFPVFEFDAGFSPSIGENTGLYNQLQASSVSSSDTILDTLLLPNLSFCDDNVSAGYADGRGTPSNCSNLSSSANILQGNEGKVIVQKNATSTDEYTSFETILATSLDEMFFLDISAGELELDLNGDF